MAAPIRMLISRAGAMALTGEKASADASPSTGVSAAHDAGDPPLRRATGGEPYGVIDPGPAPRRGAAIHNDTTAAVPAASAMAKATV